MATENLHVTIPKRVYEEIEKRRKTPVGDISRSAYITGLLEKIFFDEADRNQKKLDF